MINILPKMYIIAKQLSNANPKRNRHKANCQKLLANAVSIPAKKAIILAPTRAGIRPCRSAIRPNIKQPTMAPTKKILCDPNDSKMSSHTQLS